VPEPEIAAEALSHALSILPVPEVVLGDVLPKVVLRVVQEALELYAGFSDPVLNVEIGVVFELFVRQAR
jgi:hypothetical protein